MRIEPEKRKCVALIDWLNVGHHPVFYTEFALGLEAGGYDVLAICPDPDLALQLVTAGRARESFDSPKKGTIYFIRVEEPEFRLGRVRPRRIGAIYSAISKFRNLELQIAREAEMRGLEASAIVYASIYDHQFEWIHYASPFLKLPWTGLYLQAQSLKLANADEKKLPKLPRAAKFFSIPTCRGLGVLDESMVVGIQRQLRKSVIGIPDPARELEKEALSNGELATRLRVFAAGRPIVALLGHLRTSKGIIAFIEAAKQSDPYKICFALAGELGCLNDSREAKFFRDTTSSCVNLWTHTEKIPTELEFDSLVNCCDVLAAAYIDFPHSSNILAKAAVYEKPVVVSEGHLMAERVRRFRTGEIVEQANASKFLDAVYRITADPKEWVKVMKPGWVAYREEHSFRRFRSRILELVDPIVQK